VRTLAESRRTCRRPDNQAGCQEITGEPLEVSHNEQPSLAAIDTFKGCATGIAEIVRETVQLDVTSARPYQR
jgi:hypothetical protein